MSLYFPPVGVNRNLSLCYPDWNWGSSPYHGYNLWCFEPNEKWNDSHKPSNWWFPNFQVRSICPSLPTSQQGAPVAIRCPWSETSIPSASLRPWTYQSEGERRRVGGFAGGRGGLLSGPKRAGGVVLFLLFLFVVVASFFYKARKTRYPQNRRATKVRCVDSPSRQGMVMSGRSGGC